MPDTENERIEAFIGDLAKVLTDLEKVSERDPEAVLLIGSLAEHLIAKSGKNDWPETKASFSEDAFKNSLDTFSRQIAEAHRDGQVKIAYALQAMAISLAGSHFDDERVIQGVSLLDSFIAAACSFYKRNAPQMQ